MEWESAVVVQVTDLRGGSRRLRVRCKLGATLDRDATEALVASALEAAMDFAASKYGMLPEDFVGRGATIEKQGTLSLASAAERRGIDPPTLEVLDVELLS